MLNSRASKTEPMTNKLNLMMLSSISQLKTSSAKTSVSAPFQELPIRTKPEMADNRLTLRAKEMTAVTIKTILIIWPNMKWRTSEN